MKTAVVAIGGNGIVQEGQKGTLEEQVYNIKKCCDPIIDLIEEGYNVVLTHGNGPQIGNALMKQERAKNIVPSYPMDACGAETQGLLGYIIKQTLENRMIERNMSKKIVSITTQVLVDKNDPGFSNPTKPVGPFFNQAEKEMIEQEKGYVMKEDSGRGYRRVVASPKPLNILEKDAIKTLSDVGFIVIAVGGGGIPVVKEGSGFKGVESVIDKDYASSLLAREIEADILIVLTGVDQVAIDFGKPSQKFLSQMTLKETKVYMAEGQFPPGSMGPKIDAAIEFVEANKKIALITSIERLKDAIIGKTGTRIIPD
ncbi:MAG TPA: carbamate kinase [Epulopiscium sp.]|nr:carbamate kinase [Candidatus Epulonipiscium sp.]